MTLCVVVFGASGDLAKKKTYPALFSLFVHKLLPEKTTIVGYARSKLSQADFHGRFSGNLKGSEEDKAKFLAMCEYVSGAYDGTAGYEGLVARVRELEGGLEADAERNRLFYMAIPPNIFVDVAKSIKTIMMSGSGWNRLIVEKPFGKDLNSFEDLSNDLNELFVEKELYRIDHYLGKELVQNLMVLRFANRVFEPVWNNTDIQSVQIVFKEDIGTMGRGGYFDNFGIIRDVMQNHLFQILTLVAMEAPVDDTADAIRDEKVKVIRAMEPLRLEDVVLGQYVAGNGEPGYLDDETVPKGSVTPTFCTAVFYVRNRRWDGVPFILRCGKAVNERKAEVRIQYREVPGKLFPHLVRNELVIRVQPREAIYLKVMAKKPGLNDSLVETELDLSYTSRYDDVKIPDAYERLIHDAIQGNQSLFVRDDELREAWRVFTPLLHQIESGQAGTPEPYEFGSRGPASSDDLIKRMGYVRSENYTWQEKTK